MHLLFIFLTIPLVSSCLRTVSSQSDFLPAPRSFSAKTFAAPPVSDAPVPTVQARLTPTFEDHVNKYSRIVGAKVFHAKTYNAGRTPSLERETVGVKVFEKTGSEEFKSKEEFRKKESISGPRSEMCASCPDLMMTSVEHMQRMCTNWQNISDNFDLQMDSQQPKMSETTTVSECRRTIACEEPKMIVRWLNFATCDVHTAWDKTDFNVNCNGTHWTMHGFPVDGITCAKNH